MSEDVSQNIVFVPVMDILIEDLKKKKDSLRELSIQVQQDVKHREILMQSIESMPSGKDTLKELEEQKNRLFLWNRLKTEIETLKHCLANCQVKIMKQTHNTQDGMDIEDGEKVYKDALIVPMVEKLIVDTLPELPDCVICGQADDKCIYTSACIYNFGEANTCKCTGYYEYCYNCYVNYAASVLNAYTENNQNLGCIIFCPICTGSMCPFDVKPIIIEGNIGSYLQMEQNMNTEQNMTAEIDHKQILITIMSEVMESNANTKAIIERISAPIPQKKDNTRSTGKRRCQNCQGIGHYKKTCRENQDNIKSIANKLASLGRSAQLF